jgi:threonine 3-dehydrogenase
VKALVKPYGQVGLKYVTDAPHPEIGPRDVLVRVLVASICGSDIHIYDSDPVFRERIGDGMTVGHEFCGQVDQVGEHVTTIAVGDIVAAESHVVCGTCHYCLNGVPHLCQEVAGIGFDRAGCFAEYIAIPAENAFLKPADLPIEIAAFIEPFGNALDTAMCVDLFGKSVLVTGLGPQGLMALAVARAAGARRVIGTEVSPYRRRLAQGMLELHGDGRERANDLILDATRPDIAEQVFQATNGLGVDVVLEMSGHPTAISTAGTVLKHDGHLVALGLPGGAIEFDWSNHLVLKGTTFHGIYGRHLYQTWFTACELLESRAVQLEPLITHRLPMERFDEGFQLLKRGEAAKVVLYPTEADYAAYGAGNNG